MRLSRGLEATLALALREARQRRHEYLCIEHVLYALLHDDAVAEIVRACGGDVERLKRDLVAYLEGQIERLPEGHDTLPQQTLGFQRILPMDDGTYADGTFVQDLDGGEPTQLPAESETEAVWSPDGSQVLLAHDGSIVVAEMDGSNPRDLAGGYAPVWSPDGTRVLLGYDMNQDGLPVLALVDLEGNEIWSGAIGSAPTWSPDGTRIAVEIVYPEPMVQVLNAATGEVLWEAEGSQPNWGS